MTKIPGADMGGPEPLRIRLPAILASLAIIRATITPTPQGTTVEMRKELDP